MAVWGGLTNSCEKKRSEKQRRTPLEQSFYLEYLSLLTVYHVICIIIVTQLNIYWIEWMNSSCVSGSIISIPPNPSHIAQLIQDVLLTTTCKLCLEKRERNCLKPVYHQGSGLKEFNSHWVDEHCINSSGEDNDVVPMQGTGAPRCFNGKESVCQCRRCRFDPWVWKISWRRKWQPTPVFLPGKSHT